MTQGRKRWGPIIPVLWSPSPFLHLLCCCGQKLIQRPKERSTSTGKVPKAKLNFLTPSTPSESNVHRSQLAEAVSGPKAEEVVNADATGDVKRSWMIQTANLYGSGNFPNLAKTQTQIKQTRKQSISYTEWFMSWEYLHFSQPSILPFFADAITEMDTGRIFF